MGYVAIGALLGGAIMIVIIVTIILIEDVQEK